MQRVCGGGRAGRSAPGTGHPNCRSHGGICVRQSARTCRRMESACYSRSNCIRVRYNGGHGVSRVRTRQNQLHSETAHKPVFVVWPSRVTKMFSFTIRTLFRHYRFPQPRCTYTKTHNYTHSATQNCTMTTPNYGFLRDRPEVKKAQMQPENVGPHLYMATPRLTREDQAIPTF